MPVQLSRVSWGWVEDMAVEVEEKIAAPDGVPDYNKKQHDGQMQQSNGHVPAADGQPVILGKKSPGVLRVEVISSHMTLVDRIILFIGIFLLAYAYGLDGTLRFTFQVSFTSMSI